MAVFDDGDDDDDGGDDGDDDDDDDNDDGDDDDDDDDSDVESAGGTEVGGTDERTETAIVANSVGGEAAAVCIPVDLVMTVAAALGPCGSSWTFDA